MKKKIVTLLATALILTSTINVFAATISLNNGGAEWRGGINSSDIVYSQLVDMKADKLAHKATVWVESASGNRVEKTGTTKGLTAQYAVKASVGKTFSIFNRNKSGYKNYEVVSAK